MNMGIEDMKMVDVTKVNPEDLVDIREVKVNENLNPKRKLNDFINQIGNPYCYKYGDYIVKISFEETVVTLTERLQELILKTAGGM